MKALMLTPVPAWLRDGRGAGVSMRPSHRAASCPAPLCARGLGARSTRGPARPAPPGGRFGGSPTVGTGPRGRTGSSTISCGTSRVVIGELQPVAVDLAHLQHGGHDRLCLRLVLVVHQGEQQLGYD